MSMNLECAGGDPAAFLPERALAVPVGESKKRLALPTWIQKLPDDLRGALAAALDSAEFTGAVGENIVVRTASGTGILVGAGKRASAETLRRIYGTLVQAASKAKITTLVVAFFGGRDVAVSAEAATVGAILANYQFNVYLSDSAKRPTPVAALTFWDPDAKNRRAVVRGMASGRIIAEATTRVRDLVNTPANDLTPESYAAIARDRCREAGVKLQVLGPREIEKAKMGAVIAVGQGSANAPRFLIATYTGRQRQPDVVDTVLVGKGVTFDTGGISLKPPPNMWEMRGDMMGSAVMLSAICAAAKLKVQQNVVMLAPLVENMPSAQAYRPGDVIRTLSGLTIEIMSTDAEGRLILADALTYAQRYKPAAVIDCATLTGAVVVALGDAACGVFTDHEALWRRVKKAADATGERAWRMPLFEDYDKQIESDVADMKNSGGREGGACVAARLLRKFTGDLPWVHIDIAGVDNYKTSRAYCPKGASGFGARLIIDFLRG